MKTRNANSHKVNRFDQPFAVFGGTPISWLVVFLACYAILFLGMTRRPGVFDEGIVLTASMRVASGQLPHRDFYTLYGPGQFYMLSGLFRLFGQSILVERLFDVFTKALVVTTVYSIASAFCRPWIAAYSTFMVLFWLFGLNQWSGSPIIPISLLNLIGTALLLPIMFSNVSARKLVVVGGISGMATLLRYDTGVALLTVHLSIAAASAYHRYDGVAGRIRAIWSTSRPYLLGFAVLTLPPLVYYLSVASVRPLVHDMLLYSMKYYHRGRNVPFPGIPLNELENLGVYLPVLIAGFSFYATVAHRINLADHGVVNPARWPVLLNIFALLTVVMYLKGLVRPSLFQLYLAIVPSLLLLAILFEHRSAFGRFTRFWIICLMWLSPIPVTSLDGHAIEDLYQNHLSMPGYLVSVARQSTTMKEKTWCDLKNSLTMGMCFLPEEERINTTEFITSHTRQDERLYVGLTNHDKIFANDNIIYFATQRLPATRWSELDPDLESRYDVQTQMMREFEATTPQYVILDSEFEDQGEPNDSSRSSGVTLLDDYIQSKYHEVEEFEDLSIWQRGH